MAVDQFARMLAMGAHYNGSVLFTEEEKQKLAAISNPIVLKGKVATKDGLKDIEKPQAGWLYFVGQDEMGEFEEYVYTLDGNWELVGLSKIDLSDYATKSALDSLQEQLEETESKLHTQTSVMAKDKEKLVDIANAGQKNLFDPTLKSEITINGVTCTPNADGTFTINGTNNTEKAAVFTLKSDMNDFVVEERVLSGCPQGGDYQNGYALYAATISPDRTFATDTGSGIKFIPPDSTYSVRVVVRPGITVQNLVFKPMICNKSLYDIDPSFQPYAMSNAELTKKLNELLSSIQ